MNKEIIIMIGIPGSGKSTYVKQNFTNSHQIVCADAVRLAMGCKFHIGQEPMVKAICETMAASFMEKDLPVVIDETNTRYESIQKWVNLAKRYGYKIKGIFIDVDANECKKRRQCKEGKFPEQTIDRMAINLQILFSIKNLNILDELVTIKDE